MADSKLEWLDGPSMREKRAGCAAAVHGGKLVVVGGYDEGWNTLSSVAVLDLATNEWSDGPPMREKRSGCAAAFANGKLVVVGGDDDGYTTLDSVAVLSGLGDGWWSPTPHCHHTMCSAGGQAAVWTVLAVAARTHWQQQQFGEPIGDATRASITAAVPHPALPLELWHLILERTKVWELGGGGGGDRK